MLIYSAICSVDGYTTDESGGYDWAAPGEDVHAYVNEQERGVGTYLYGRRIYETMRAWQDITSGSPAVTDYADLWRAAEKIVYSATLTSVSTPRTRLEPRFDVDAVRSIVASADTDVSIGGPTLAAAAIAAGLVDEYRLITVPVSVGGGLPAFPRSTFLRFRLVEVRPLTGGVVASRFLAER